MRLVVGLVGPDEVSVLGAAGGGRVQPHLLPSRPGSFGRGQRVRKGGSGNTNLSKVQA